MTLNLPLSYFVWTEEYCQTSPNKNKSPNLWHLTSILVCLIFAYMRKFLYIWTEECIVRKRLHLIVMSMLRIWILSICIIKLFFICVTWHACICLINLSRLVNRWNKIFKFGRRLFMLPKFLRLNILSNVITFWVDISVRFDFWSSWTSNHLLEISTF